MKLIEHKFRSGTRSMLFECPGCEMLHSANVAGTGHPVWTWNGSMDKPTFSPSILVRFDHWTPPATTPEVCAKIKSGEIVQTRVSRVCHSFVRDGKIQFLEDCTHALAGKIVELPECDE